MPNYLSRMKPNGANGTEYKLKDEELREAFDVFKEDIKGTQTATGNPITLTDASETYAQGLSVELEPVQDLHGYDFPWVGGAGKNKFQTNFTDRSYNGIIYTKNSDGTVSLSGIASGTSYNLIGSITLEAGSYIFNGGISDSIYLNIQNPPYYSKSSDDITFTVNETTTFQMYANVTNGTNTNGKILKPMIRLSTETDPTFAPYSNICPISGYEGVEVDDCGKNLFNKATYTNNKIVDNTGAEVTSYNHGHSDYIRVKSGSYYAQHIAGNSWYSAITYDINKNVIGYIGLVEESGWDKSGVMNIPDGVAYIILNFATENLDIIQLEVGTTPTAYEPYTTRTASVTFGQTVYGAIINFLTGECKVTLGFDKFKNLTFGDGSTGGKTRYYAAVSGMLNSGTRTMKDLICDSYETISDSRAYANVPDFCIYNSLEGSSVAIFVHDTRFSSAAEFKSAMGECEFCYELATPFTIQLTPQELKLLQDTNNLSTNGTTITLDYIPNNSIGDAVKASEEYTDRAVEGKADNTTAYVDLPGNYDTTNKNFPTRSATSGSVENCLTYINDLADKLYTAINSHATALANIPTKTVVVDHRAIDVGDEFNISLPLSYKFLIIELYIYANGECGSIVSTDFANGSVLSIVANGHGASYWCDLSRMANTITVDGNFYSTHGELTITAF